ncbi:hypothetical protein Pint_32491 [Pistacia integerrima]|uniref:Uncharacterized protein n=1 Tax=Pistacia integerrima TaxID=434235 RepID=A0ACC0XQV7_9ROSI|nr:hypothetical protein Pint_32491 [Pistacia integerrima]
MQVESFQYWPDDYNSTDSPLEEIGLYFAEKYGQGSCFEFPSPSISMEDFSNDISSVLLSSPVYDVEQYLLNLDEVDIPLNDQFMADEFEDFSELMVSGSSPMSPQLFAEEDTKSLNLSPISSETSSIDVSVLPSDQTFLVFPSEEMEVDDQLSILHLLKAYGEAMELEQKDLATEIIRRLTDKACPTGATLERLAYFLIQAFEKKLDYLSQESSKNYAAAFRAFYQIFPYGRFAHFTANSMILEAIPEDARNLEEISTRKSMALSEMGLKAWRLSRNNLMEAKELVSEGNSLYWAKNTGENEMVLGCMGTPLVKVSSWR